MKLDNFTPAKNNVILEVVKVAVSGHILLHEDTTAGYYRVAAVGPLCEKTKVGDYIISALQMGIELKFEDVDYMQIPEFGIDGYYKPSEEELKNPTPVFDSTPEEEEEELKIIDSEDSDNELGSELGLRED